MTHIVYLEEHNKAVYKHLSYTNETKGVIGPLIRKAIEDGLMDRDDTVVVMRGSQQVFKPCNAYIWADYDIKEGSGGLRRVKYKPFEM